MELPTNLNLPVPQFGESADRIKEQNTYRRYVFMLNAKDRKVPVAVVHVKDALSRGYKHIDSKIIDEDTSAPAHGQNDVETDPMKVMANATKQLAESQEAMVEVMSEVTGKKPSKKKKAAEVATEEKPQE